MFHPNVISLGMEQKERKKRRSHEEVVAAREAYRAEQERKREERIKKKQALMRKPREKKVSVPKPVAQYSKYPTYEGTVEIGDTIAAKFAGAIVSGELIDIQEHKQTMFQENALVLYLIKSSDGYKYPVRREAIIAKKED